MITEAEAPNVTETAAPKREQSPEQKQAATLRRDATLLRKYGQADAAAKLEAEADVLFPVTKQGKRVDPLAVLTTEQQSALKNYFRTTAGFARLCQIVSAKKLTEIVDELSA